MNLNNWLVYGMSFIWIKNKSGPSIDPCGTPIVITRLSDAVPSISVYCCLFVK